MVQKIQTLTVDDIDGSDAEGTVRFGLDGRNYEIDLNVQHSQELRSALSKYVSHARRVGGPARRAARGRTSAPPADTTEIRTWAREQGYDIKDRGRVPADITAKFIAAAAGAR